MRNEIGWILLVIVILLLASGLPLGVYGHPYGGYYGGGGGLILLVLVVLLATGRI